MNGVYSELIWYTQNVKVIDLAVIIPTLNEEAYIGILLDSLATQTVQPKEIIIVDAYSKDKTIEEIEKRKTVLPQLQYFQIPKDTISRQRNLGVQKSSASYLLFIDADMFFRDKNALEMLVANAFAKKADFAIPKILPDSTNRFDAFLYVLHNGIPKTMKPWKAFATTQCLLVTRTIFEKAGRFDEKVQIAEDFDLVARMQKKGGKFVIIDNASIYSSVRRLERDGRLRFVGLLTLSCISIFFLGYKRNPVQKAYTLGDHT